LGIVFCYTDPALATPLQSRDTPTLRNGSSQRRWALLLTLLLVATLARFWQLGSVPKGLYRDEAWNGIDAVGVLEGERPLFFTNNNGREPLYIYLTSAAVALLGRTPMSVRVVAALAGSLTTVLVFGLASRWFNHRTGYIAAALWTFTLWPLHLSRIGLRPILLPALFTAFLLLATVGFQRLATGKKYRWLLLSAGLLYGISFYTYLAARVTPALLILFVVYLLITKRARPVWPALPWLLLGFIPAILPLAIFFIGQPDLLFDRSAQVSILNENINSGDLLGTLWDNLLSTLRMFFIRGDFIVRHNPADRPIFDAIMAVPLVAGLLIALRRWRQWPYALVLLWIAAMLVPTLVAEDTPHFLRSVGILPAILFLPALALSELVVIAARARTLATMAVIAVLLASAGITYRDYFMHYAEDPRTGTWFESAAVDLANDINSQSAERNLHVDRRFYDSWPSLRFILDPDRELHYYRPDENPPQLVGGSSVVYAWPYEGIDSVAAGFFPPALLTAEVGSLAQGDKDPAPYPLYIRYTYQPVPDVGNLALFGNVVELRQVLIGEEDDNILVDLFWTAPESIDSDLVAFVHLSGPEGMLVQSDHVPGGDYLPPSLWQSGVMIVDRHNLPSEGLDLGGGLLFSVGLYDQTNGRRLTISDSFDQDGNDVFAVERELR